jgi:uncharacterized membrane protein YraQ (UPF0718 family)
MITSFAIILSVVVVLGTMAWRRSRKTFRQAVDLGIDQGRILILRIPLAVLLGALLVELIPQEMIQPALGQQSGMSGVLIASIAGALLPGGPYLSFPIAVALYKAGVGAPQLIAMLSGWSVYAVYRTLAFELPMMGGRFIALRLASSITFPFLAGTVALFAFTGTP